MKKTTSIATAAVLLLILIGIGVSQKSKNKSAKAIAASIYLHEEGHVHGTTYHITYEAPEGKSLQTEYEAEFKQFDLSLSTFEPQSIISRINKNDSNVKIDNNFRTVFEEGEKVSAASGGAFDMTVAPLVNAWGFGFDKKDHVTESQVKEIMKHVGYQKVKIEGDHLIKSDPAIMLDASAIAKGYSSDVVARLLEKHGVKNYMVEIGGECVVKGHNQEGKNWTMGITKTVDDSTQQQNELQQIIEMSHGGLATSGNYRQFYYKNGKKFAHTIDPHTGHPVNHSLLSSTIYAPTCMEADAYATACMVLGIDKAMSLIEAHPELEGYFIFSDANNKYDVKFTSGFKNMIKK